MYKTNLNAKLSQMREALIQTGEYVFETNAEHEVRRIFGQDYWAILFRHHLTEIVLRDELNKQGITADNLDGALQSAMLPNDLVGAGIMYFAKQFDSHYDSIAKGYSATLTPDEKEALATRQRSEAFLGACKELGKVVRAKVDDAFEGMPEADRIRMSMKGCHVVLDEIADRQRARQN